MKNNKIIQNNLSNFTYKITINKNLVETNYKIFLKNIMVMLDINLIN